MRTLKITLALIITLLAADVNKSYSQTTLNYESKEDASINIYYSCDSVNYEYYKTIDIKAGKNVIILTNPLLNGMHVVIKQATPKRKEESIKLICNNVTFN